MSSKKAPKARRPDRIDLRLFVAGSGSRSLRSVDSVKRALEKHASGEYHLSVVDIYVHPEEASRSQIVAVPTLVRECPKPLRMYVGEIPASMEQDARFSWMSSTPPAI